jgi:membrane fusion protein, heavy metal efflux system
MMNSNFFAKSIALLSLLSIWVSFSPAVFSHGGHSHGNEFGGEVQAGSKEVTIDAATAQSLGIKAVPVQRQKLPVEIVATGQIELLPNQKVEITSPIKGKILQLLVQPGATVKAGQAVATMTSPELGDLRVSAQEKKNESTASLQQAQAELQFAQEGYRRIEQIAKADREQAQSQLATAQARLTREKQLVKSGALIQVAKTNYQRQQQISKAEISAAQYAVNFAAERYQVDLKSAADGIGTRRQALESQARLAEARAVLAKALNQPGLTQAESELRKAENDLPVRELREAEKQVAEAKGQLAKALNQKSLIEADSQLRKAKSAILAAQTRQSLSAATYNSRAAQLGNSDSNGVITVKSPIDGTVADRDITAGQSVPEAGAKIMTVTNDRQVFATANIYERDLAKVKIGQEAKVKVGNETFTGTVSRIGSAIDSQSRVVPVQVALRNEGNMKPDMFAELRLITEDVTEPIVAVPSAAIVEADDKKLVYVQNGTSYQPVAVELGQTIGDFVEVKSGLFVGDEVVTQRALQLYSQSLKAPAHDHNHGEAKATAPMGSKMPFNLLWLTLPGVITAGGVAWWWFKRNKNQDQNDTSVFEAELLEAEIVSERPNPLWHQSHNIADRSVADRNISTYDVEAEAIKSGSLIKETEETQVNHEVKAETVVVSPDIVDKLLDQSAKNGVTTNSKITTMLNNLLKRSATK